MIDAESQACALNLACRVFLQGMASCCIAGNLHGLELEHECKEVKLDFSMLSKLSLTACHAMPLKACELPQHRYMGAGSPSRRAGPGQ